MSVSLQCEFWAVGQGLFSSGKVLDGGNTVFTWVYDCGTASKQKYLRSAIDTLYCAESHLDLLAISHFDEDHVSGLDYLFKNKYKQPNYVLLPYLPLWQRIMLLIANDIEVKDERFQFYLNPIKYLSTYYPEIMAKTTVILVPEYQYVEDSELKENDKLSFYEWKGNDEFITVELLNWKKLVKEINLLDPSKPLSVNGVEFFPYNIPLTKFRKKPKNILLFQQNVNSILNQNQLSQSTIEQLENLYSQEFGSSDTKKNIISLFLYISDINIKSNEKKAVLYCGDGYLNNIDRLSLLQQAIGKDRFENIYCLQVAHHGAERNHFKGLADEIQPIYSVFSANPNDRRYGHPHSSVLRDFANYKPIVTGTTHHFKFKI